MQTIVFIVVLVAFGIALGIQFFKNAKEANPRSFDDNLKDVVWAFAGIMTALTILYIVVKAGMDSMTLVAVPQQSTTEAVSGR